MKLRALLPMVILLTGCDSHSAAKERNVQHSDLRPGETMVRLPLEPYQWRKDPRCYTSKDTFDPERTFDPSPEALKWRKATLFSGYLYTSFEGWSFVAAKRTDNPDGLGIGRYQASVDYEGKVIPGLVQMKPQTYWVQFVGREALCNSQRPDDTHFDIPFSPNLVMIDRFETRTRVE